MQAVRELRRRVDEGFCALRIVPWLWERPPTDRLYYAPKHPYTEALMSAIPEANPDAVMRPVLLTGERPDPADPPAGCRFHTRCRYADEQCRRAAVAFV